MKTLVLKRPFTSVASQFLMLHLGVLKIYIRQNIETSILTFQTLKQKTQIQYLLYSKGKSFSLTSLSG